MWSLITLPFRIVWSVLSVAWNVVWGAVSLAFGLVGGIISLVIGVALVALIIGLISAAFDKHRSAKNTSTDTSEEFASFYQDKSGSVK